MIGCLSVIWLYTCTSRIIFHSINLFRRSDGLNMIWLYTYIPWDCLSRHSVLRWSDGCPSIIWLCTYIWRTISAPQTFLRSSDGCLNINLMVQVHLENNHHNKDSLSCSDGRLSVIWIIWYLSIYSLHSTFLPHELPWWVPARDLIAPSRVRNCTDEPLRYHLGLVVNAA